MLQNSHLRYQWKPAVYIPVVCHSEHTSIRTDSKRKFESVTAVRRTDDPIENLLPSLWLKSDAHDRLIVVFDEFQEIANLDPGTDKLLRAVMQLHKSLNYLFLGSEESMMTAIFEDIKSPFFHFGALMHLGKIPYQDFYDFLTERFAVIRKEQAAEDARQILDLTKCHPFYTQQLAAVFWDLCVRSENQASVPAAADASPEKRRNHRP